MKDWGTSYLTNEIKHFLKKKYPRFSLRKLYNLFYKLVVKSLITTKYSDLTLRDQFWDYDVNEHADKFLIEVENHISQNKLTVRIKIPRSEVKRSFLETAAMLSDNLETVLDWYTKEEKHDL